MRHILFLSESQSPCFSVMKDLRYEHFDIVPHIVHNEKDVYDSAQKQQFHLIIIEIEEKTLYRFDLLDEWQQNPILNNIPVMIVSSLNSPEIKVDAFEKGAVEYIVYPFHNAELVARIKMHLNVKVLKDTLKKHTSYLEELVHSRIKEIEEIQNVTMFTLAKLAESRDPETGKHLERISHYSKLLATKLFDRGKFLDTIDNQFIKNIFVSSPLHDIGKVGIEDRVLLKAGKLSEEEYEIMKKHTLIGGQTLEESAKKFYYSSFLKMGIEIAYYHHEKYDGTGYPFGLKGENIPLSARIVALADVYDALTSKRVYKPALPHEKAFQIIIEGKGVHFDPVIVQAFIECEKEFTVVAKNFIDEEVYNDEWNSILSSF